MRKALAPVSWIMVVLMLAAIPMVIDGSPESIDAEIQMNNSWEAAVEEGEDAVLTVDGSFILTERTGLDRITPVTATLSVSEGQWDATPRQTVYNDVGTENWVTFSIDLTIPEDSKAGQSSSYTVTILFQGQTSEITETAGFSVLLTSASDDDGDNDGNGDEDSIDNAGASNGGFPIWPVFVLGLIILLVFAGIWAYRNLEIVREVDGRHKIYLREKDTGRIIGKEK